MAYGQFTGYQPGPTTIPGSYSFQRDGAPPLLVTGPQAEALKAKLDASQQFAPQAVAQNTPSGGGPSWDHYLTDAGVSSLVGGAPPAAPAAQAPAASPAPGPNMSVAPDANMSAAPAQSAPAPVVPGRFAQAFLGGESPAPATGAPPPASAPQPSARGAATPILFDPKTHQTVYLRPGGDRNNPADMFTMAPGSAPTKGGFMPSSMKVESATTAARPEDLDALRENSIDQKLAYQIAYDLHAETLAEQRATLDAQADANAAAAQEARARLQAVQQQTDALQAKYDSAKQDYAESKVDPERYMRGNWTSGLGMVLGTLGAGIAKSPNFVANYVSQRIADDIRGQEAQIKIRGDKQQTLLGDLQRQLGSLDLARTAYQGVKLEEAKRQTLILANHQQTREAAAQYVQGAAQLDALLQKNDLDFRQQAAGKVTSEYRYRAPSGGSPGGPQPLTREQFEGASHGAPKVHVSAKSQEAANAVEDSKAALNEAAAAVGMKWDPEKQEFVGDAKVMAGDEKWSTKALIDARHILGANAGTIAEAAGERKPPVGQIKTWVEDKLPGGADTAANYRAFLNGAMRNVERKGRHIKVETTEPDLPEREEAPE